jgi:hypothetical protein
LILMTGLTPSTDARETPFQQEPLFCGSIAQAGGGLF